MANATGIPAIAWVGLWMLISVAMIGIGLRLYATSTKNNGGVSDLPFED